MQSKKSNVQPIKVMDTPKVLTAVGMPQLPIYIPRDVVRKATNEVKHNVMMSTIEELPKLLSKPVAVFKSKTTKGSLVVLIDAKDKSGRPVIVPIHLNVKEGRLEVNKVASLYGDSRVSRLGVSNLLYLDAKKKPELVRLIRVQFPVSGSPTQGLGKSVLAPDDIVNNDLLFSRTKNTKGKSDIRRPKPADTRTAKEWQAQQHRSPYGG